ncbi:uncharacterized protein I206_104941 [Kwoniella pini CBS 10737]|uniref:RRM domain-containing protein n=1 Tax=Kwoniella pini CBS 10737 TaxID=1296096 RepID=A0AAJ8MRH5_9TREE
MADDLPQNALVTDGSLNNINTNDDILSDLSQILADLEEKPDNVPLIRKQIYLMLRLGMSTEVLDAYNKLSSLIMLDEKHDYFSIPLLHRHIEFILSCFRSKPISSETQKHVPYADSDVVEFLTEDNTRDMIRAIYQRGSQALADSDQLWQIWIGWEMELLGSAPDKNAAMEAIHMMYADRIKTAHTSLDQTSNAYSSFCSEHCPQQYEARMVDATEASKIAKGKLTEKRYGRIRNDFEEQLKYAPDLNAQLQVFLEYISWESDSRAKNNARGKGPQLDNLMIQSVYERAISHYTRASGPMQTSLDTTEETLRLSRHRPKETRKKKREEEVVEREAVQQQIQIESEALRALKDAEAAVWLRYGAWAETHGTSLEGMTLVFERSLAIGLLGTPNGRTTDLVSMFVYRAAFENRLEPREEVEVNKSGDSSLQLEKFLLAWAETRAPDYLEQALLIVDKPNKARLSAYQMVLLHTDILSRHSRIEQARDIFHKAIQRSDLDWPEAVYEALIRFENTHGTLGSLLDAKKRISREQEKLTKRREKAALEIQQYPAPTVSTIPEVIMDITASETAPEQAPDTIALDPSDGQDRTQKRDREHTTILLGGLPKGIAQDRVESLFTDCGVIRETTMIPNDDNVHDTALVEFSGVEAVPLALQKDRRKIDGNAISISMLWRSTLFVTNFAQEVDDATLRQLFSQVSSNSI